MALYGEALSGIFLAGDVPRGTGTGSNGLAGA